MIAGFRRRRNIGELIAPKTPRRVTRPSSGSDSGSGGGCGPCDANRCQIHLNIVTSNSVISPWDNRPKKINKKLNCKDANLVYYLKCTRCPMGPGITPHYVGSSTDFRGSRWSQHKSDMERGIGKDCPPLLRKLEEKHMVNMGSLASLDPLQGCNKRDDARAKPWIRTGGN